MLDHCNANLYLQIKLDFCLEFHQMWQNFSVLAKLPPLFSMSWFMKLQTNFATKQSRNNCRCFEQVKIHHIREILSFCQKISREKITCGVFKIFVWNRCRFLYLNNSGKYVGIFFPSLDHMSGLCIYKYHKHIILDLI